MCIFTEQEKWALCSQSKYAYDFVIGINEFTDWPFISKAPKYFQIHRMLATTRIHQNDNNEKINRKLPGKPDGEKASRR